LDPLISQVDVVGRRGSHAYTVAQTPANSNAACPHRLLRHRGGRLGTRLWSSSSGQPGRECSSGWIRQLVTTTLFCR